MSEKVLIKRLSNCFRHTERYVKRFTVMNWLTKQGIPGDTGLAQYDEIVRKDYDFLWTPILTNTVSDQLLDKVIEEKKIPLENWTTLTPLQEIPIPARATEGSAGFDLQAAVEETTNIHPGEFKLIPTGLSVSMPKTMELQIRPRSGLAAKYGVTVLNSPGTIDSDYGGEIKVVLINHGKETFIINRGDRIAQGVFNTVTIPTLTEVDSLEKTTRGSGGFGSTGVK